MDRQPDLRDLTLSVTRIAREVAGFQKRMIGKFGKEKVKSKGIHDYVTFVDKESEAMLVSSLGRLMPGVGFLAEEGTVEDKGDARRWIIDPLDGTTNYIHGVPVYCISIALAEGDDLKLGVVLEAGRDECFYAWAGGGAWLDGQPVRVSSTAVLEDSLLATGFPYHDYSRLDAYLKLFARFMSTTRGLRRLGSAAADLAYVACGRFDGFYEYGLNPWDVAAGVLLVSEAGGRNSDFSGGDTFISGKEVVSSNTDMHYEFLEMIRQYMK